MRVSRRGAGLLAVAALLLPGAAHADELLVMPYACHMAGGQPVLTPGPEQSHRIIGPRDQRKYSACSPVNPGMCRHWTVHRFDLDCDGTRVPWVSVVAATNEGSRRAWLLDGRLVLRMGPAWSLAPDDPCAREADLDDRIGSRRMRRYCADQLAMAPPPVVEMPFGYAPMLGIDGIFVKAAPSVAGGTSLPPVSAGPPPRSAAAAPLPELFPSDEPPRGFIPGDAPPVKPGRVEPQPSISPPPVPKVAAPPVVPPAPPAEVAKAPPASPAPAQAPKAAAAEPKPAQPTPNLGPRIVSISPPAPKAPETPGAAPAVAANTAADAKPPAAAAAPAPKPATVDQRKDAEPAAAAPDPAAGAGEGASGISLLGVFRATTTGAIIAFAGLALGLLTAFALARRREYQTDARRRPRDLAAVSLDGRRARGRARGPNAPAPGHPPHGPAMPHNGVGPAQAAPAQAPAASAARWGTDVPRTRAEALRVLGIGVAPTANDAAIKKIVDGLRQSWHPDLAKDPADRALRELRSKQINVAWDLLRSQRAEV